MSAINVQESFLNVALAGGKQITVHLLNGAKVSGNVRSFDKYSIVLENNTQAQLIFKEQAPWFTIAHAVQLKPISKRVVDFKLSPFGRHTFYGVDVKE